VLDDFGSRLGRAWRETNEEHTGRATLMADLLNGEYSNPARVVAFNTAEGWSRDVTDDIVEELRQRCSELDEVPESLREFLSSLP
jgi:hypothetical protein